MVATKKSVTVNLFKCVAFKCSNRLWGNEIKRSETFWAHRQASIVEILSHVTTIIVMLGYILWRSSVTISNALFKSLSLFHCQGTMVSSHVQGIYSILVKQTEQRNSVAISWFNVKFHWAATNEILSMKYFLPDSTAYWLKSSSYSRRTFRTVKTVFRE